MVQNEGSESVPYLPLLPGRTDAYNQKYYQEKKRMLGHQIW